jgi:hypothetical protein
VTSTISMLLDQNAVAHKLFVLRVALMVVVKISDRTEGNKQITVCKTFTKELQPPCLPCHQITVPL